MKLLRHILASGLAMLCCAKFVVVHLSSRYTLPHCTLFRAHTSLLWISFLAAQHPYLHTFSLQISFASFYVCLTFLATSKSFSIITVQSPLYRWADKICTFLAARYDLFCAQGLKSNYPLLHFSNIGTIINRPKYFLKWTVCLWNLDDVKVILNASPWKTQGKEM